MVYDWTLDVANIFDAMGDIVDIDTLLEFKEFISTSQVVPGTMGLSCEILNNTRKTRVINADLVDNGRECKVRFIFALDESEECYIMLYAAIDYNDDRYYISSDFGTELRTYYVYDKDALDFYSDFIRGSRYKNREFIIPDPDSFKERGILPDYEICSSNITFDEVTSKFAEHKKTSSYDKVRVRFKDNSNN